MSRLSLTMKRFLPAAAVLAVSAFLGGCAAGTAVPTCSEFADMNPDTGIFSRLSDDQSEAIRHTLSEGGFDDGAWNETLGRTAVIAFCNIHSGTANQNQDRPISEAF